MSNVVVLCARPDILESYMVHIKVIRMVFIVSGKIYFNIKDVRLVVLSIVEKYM